MDSRDIELTERHMEEQLQHRLDTRERYQGESATECQRCGDEIPEGRRQALPGIQTCVDCAALAGK